MKGNKRATIRPQSKDCSFKYLRDMSGIKSLDIFSGWFHFHFRGCAGRIQTATNTVSSPSSSAWLTGALAPWAEKFPRLWRLSLIELCSALRSVRRESNDEKVLKRGKDLALLTFDGQCRRWMMDGCECDSISVKYNSRLCNTLIPLGSLTVWLCKHSTLLKTSFFSIYKNASACVYNQELVS